ncbi:MAG: nucleotide sugar dehydrogenase [Acidobacteriota bacterium]|nr:nucleotide sugar dehydrogenase [Acidobacteriota bacterium]
MSSTPSHRDPQAPELHDLSWICVSPSTPLKQILERHQGAPERGLPAGIALVLDEEGGLLGTVTDGDARRALLRTEDLTTPAREVMRPDPIRLPEGLSFREILRRLPKELERRGRRSQRFLGKIILVDEQDRPTRVLDYHQLWEQRVASHRHVTVVGLGYVGLTLALVLAEEGLRVTGVDLDEDKICALEEGRPYVHEPGLPELLREQLSHSFSVTTDLPEGSDVFIVAVGTPVEAGLDSQRPEPSLAMLEAATRAVAARLTPGALVILRSTVPVGTTRGFVLPLLEQLTGLRGGRDFHLSFAPERTAEGRALEELRTLPQIIGGLDEDSVEATAALFRELTHTLVRVESIEAAELAKLVNNSFRDLSFAFANQVVQLAAPFNLDAVEVIQAANRGYPRDPVPLPSPGVGGPCLSKDPYILAAARQPSGEISSTDGLTLSELGRRVNESMVQWVATAVLSQLRRLGKEPGECSVLICGLAFKGQPETSDIRSSTSLEIARLLSLEVGELFGHDPVVAPEEIAAAGLQPAQLPAGFDGMDAVLFLNNHRSYSRLDVFATIRALAEPPLLFDGWHLFRPEEVLQARPGIYMGLGFTRSSLEES